MKYAQFETGPNCKPVNELVWIVSAQESDIIGKAVFEYCTADPKLRNAKVLLQELDFACLVFTNK